ncbi:hypothetical protein [Paenibacillus macerans]|uniref:hypothetical protein n=1 Tax=Paenibacillus macerans TaxID=44252 RepID=UPI002041BCEA|nr:hypothetical protein [Paenibacillus macerans]MCM3698989.1 hypothetical protein [Paenibacillus macerans]
MENSNERLMIGVQLRPGRASALLKASSYEATDLIIGLDNLWGGGAANLRDELLYASTVTERFHILENHLLARIDCSRRPNSAIEFALLEYRSG